MNEANHIIEPLCESCLKAGERVQAVMHSRNPHFKNYDLCEACADEYDSRQDEYGNWTT